MILLLDTSTPLCKLSFIDGDNHFEHEWQADRTLARHLLSFISDNLHAKNKTWSDITAIGVFEGSGSFTGLRIGLTVLNTIASSNHIPIVGGRGDTWKEDVINRLRSGQDDHIVMPFYGSEAHITAPRK